MFNLSTPLTVSLVGGVLFLVFVVVAALRFKKGKLPIVSATLSLLALAAAILGLFFHAGQSDQAPNMIWLGHILSAVSFAALAASLFARDTRRLFLLQAADSFLGALSNLCFGGFSGASTNGIATVRNLLKAHGRFAGVIVWLTLVAQVAIGVLVNNRGLLGLLPVAATVEYTLAVALTDGVRAVKLALLANILMWAAYGALIGDWVGLSKSAFLMLLTLHQLQAEKKP